MTPRASSRRVASEILDVHSTTAASSLRAVSSSSAAARASLKSTDSLSLGNESATSSARRRAARRTCAPNCPASLASSAAIAGESTVVRTEEAEISTLGVTFSFFGGEWPARLGAPAPPFSIAAAYLRLAPPVSSASAPSPFAPSRGMNTCLMSCSSASSDGPELARAPKCTRASMSSELGRRTSVGESLMKYAAGADAAPGGSAPWATRSVGPSRGVIGGGSVVSGIDAGGLSGGTGSARGGDDGTDPSSSVRFASPPSAFGPRSAEGSGPSPSAGAADASRGSSGARTEPSPSSVARSPFCSVSPPTSSGAETVASAFSFPLELRSNGVDRVPADASPRAFGSTYTRSASLSDVPAWWGVGMKQVRSPRAPWIEPTRAHRGCRWGGIRGGKPRTQQRTSHERLDAISRLVVVRHARGEQIDVASEAGGDLLRQPPNALIGRV